MPNSKKQRKYVLVVEDDKGVRAMLKLALQQHGLAVKIAPTGERAVEILQHYYHAIGVALIDVQMPGMDGPETLAALKQIQPKIECCFMSGNTGKYTEEHLLKLGAAHVFAKPFSSLAALVQKLTKLMARSDGLETRNGKHVQSESGETNRAG